MSQDWLNKEKRFEESFYSSRARVGITGFLFDCIAGKQEEEDHNSFDLESGFAQNSTSAAISFTEEPITFAFVSSTQMISAAVNSITSGISGLFSGWKSQPEQQQQLQEVSVQKNQNTGTDLFEVIIEGEMQKTLQNIQKSYSQVKVAAQEIPVFIDSPKMNDITAANVLDSVEKVKPQIVEMPTAEKIEEFPVKKEDLWYEGPSEEDLEDEDYMERSLSHSFYAMESYIDFSQDSQIVTSPLPKKSSEKKSLKVHFEPMVELMDSVVNNDKAAIKKILQEGQIKINDSDKLGYTMLHYAASRNHCDLIKYLVDKGADVNCLDFADWTPLHLAAIADNYKACKTLLDLGSNFEYPNDDGDMPVDLTEDAKVKKLLAEATTKKLSSKKVRAIYSWTAESPEYLSMTKSESFKILERKDQDWWLVQNDKKRIGLVPRIFVQ